MEKPAPLTVIERHAPLVRAVVAEGPTRRHLQIRQFLPAPGADLPWLTHIWIVRWDMPAGLEHMPRTVPFPAFNLVADARRGAALHGCAGAGMSWGCASRRGLTERSGPAWRQI